MICHIESKVNRDQVSFKIQEFILKILIKINLQANKIKIMYLVCQINKIPEYQVLLHKI